VGFDGDSYRWRGSNCMEHLSTERLAFSSWKCRMVHRRLDVAQILTLDNSSYREYNISNGIDSTLWDMVVKKIELFPTLLCGFDYPESKSFRTLFDTIYEKHGRYDENNEFQTGEAEGFNLVHHEEKLNNFYKFISDCCAQYVNELGIDLDRFDVMLAKSWLSFCRNGKYVPEHSHADHHISFIYYLECPENCYKISFKDPYHININEPFHGAFFKQNVKQSNQYNTKTCSLAPKEGSVLFFPSKLIHFAEGEMFDGNRRAIAGDFMLVYKDIQNKTPWGMYHQKYWKIFK